MLGLPHLDQLTIKISINCKQLNRTIKNIARPNRKWEIQDSGLQTGCTHISDCRHDRNTLSKAISMFLRSSYLTEQSRTFRVLTGSRKSKMAASKLGVSIFRLVNMIGTQFQRLCLCFRSQATRKDYWGYFPTLPGYIVHQRWRTFTGS